tara:strand:- start:80736 stop:81065 length:330 start_codon:yes stop_codon:yes gene_type:complete
MEVSWILWNEKLDQKLIGLEGRQPFFTRVKNISLTPNLPTIFNILKELVIPFKILGHVNLEFKLKTSIIWQDFKMKKLSFSANKALELIIKIYQVGVYCQNLKPTPRYF